ncbi:MAG: acyl-CoA dehydrogenase family protein [Gammaproteobacteria bacterium]|nr:acyl-CoA dehydrogenase family protein [Gammaproteobacteria bacterium]
MSQPTQETVRAEARAWLEANWDPDLDLKTWRAKLVESGWGMPAWPKEWHGKGLSAALAAVVDKEFRALGAIGVARSGPRMLAAATLLEHGSDFLKEKFLRRILTGEDHWCQLFSEPGSGSDLAGAMTRADFKDGQWIVNGQKVWTTSAHHAQYGFLLARTDWNVPKHQGLSYFIIEMEQPGVLVQPLRQMNGHASFNQVFFTDAVVPTEYLVANLGEGWKVATTTLMHERRAAAEGMASGPQSAKRVGKAYDQERAEFAITMEPYTWYPQRAGRPDLVIERAQATGRNTDPVVRQEIAKLLTLHRAAHWTQRRARAAQQLGRPPGPEGSLGKLVGSHVARASANVHTLINAADAMLTGDDSPMNGIIAEILVSTPAASIAGGTDEIQRNIIAERVLGMPKEPLTGMDRPFKDVPKNTVQPRER